MALPSARPPRIVLRPLDLATARAILDGRRQPDWTAGYPTDGDRDIARFFFERRPAAETRSLWLPHQILEAASGTVIGGIGCHRPPDPNGSVEIGYGIAPEWRNQGFTTEAVRALVAAFADGGVATVVARTDPDNQASQAVLRHVDFTQVGVGVDGLLIWQRKLP